MTFLSFRVSLSPSFHTSSLHSVALVISFDLKTQSFIMMNPFGSYFTFLAKQRSTFVDPVYTLKSLTELFNKHSCPGPSKTKSESLRAGPSENVFKVPPVILMCSHSWESKSLAHTSHKEVMQRWNSSKRKLIPNLDFNRINSQIRYCPGYN